MERNVPLFIRQCVSTFLAHLSFYTIAIIGTDRYVRIKYYTNFQAIWTTKVVTSLICAGCLLALFQAITLSVALTLQKAAAIIPTNVVMDGFIVGIIILLQLLTIRRSIAVQRESTVGEPRFNKKIVKLSTRIMLLFSFFVTPFIIILNLLCYIDQDKLNDNHKSIPQFTFFFSIIFFNGNSFANTIIFLTTNVKAKKFLQTLLK